MLTPALYIVATPIGNLGDLSFRALDVLKSVDWVIAEDTRHSRTLFQHYGITTPMSSFHVHNEHSAQQQIIERLKQGQSVALISDAGTPLISDPGYLLVLGAHAENIPVIPIPGACAAITALSASGLPVDRFCFEGFLPAKAHARAERLKALRQETRTLIFYEAPHRLVESLAALMEQFGAEREAVLARELTKRFETIAKAPLEKLWQKVSEHEEQQKGEIVLLVAGYQPASADALLLDAEEQRLLAILVKEVSPQQAAKIMAKWGQRRKQEYYKFILDHSSAARISP